MMSLFSVLQCARQIQHCSTASQHLYSFQYETNYFISGKNPLLSLFLVRIKSAWPARRARIALAHAAIQAAPDTESVFPTALMRSAYSDAIVSYSAHESTSLLVHRSPIHKLLRNTRAAYHLLLQQGWWWCIPELLAVSVHSYHCVVHADASWVVITKMLATSVSVLDIMFL